MKLRIKLKLKELLKKKNISQNELSKRTGLRANTIGDLMKPNRKGFHVETLERIADALKLESIDELIDFEREV